MPPNRTQDEHRGVARLDDVDDGLHERRWSEELPIVVHRSPFVY